jgi:hypothetical protein
MLPALLITSILSNFFCRHSMLPALLW